MGASRCLKLLLLVSLIPLALRATSLLLAGHAAPAPSRRSWDRTIPTTTGVSARSAHTRPHRQLAARHRRRAEITLAAPDGARRPRQAPDAGGDWFEDDKRLAPTGSNPLHNLR